MVAGLAGDTSFYQVRVTNLSKDFQYIVHDISIDLSSLLDPDDVTDPNKLKYLASERDLTMLRGVTQKRPGS